MIKIKNLFKKKLIWIVLVLIVLLSGIKILLNISQDKSVVQQRNYVIYRLMEEEMYEEAGNRAKLMLSDKFNETTKSLLLLNFVSEYEYDIALYEARNMDINSELGNEIFEFLKKVDKETSYETQIWDFQRRVKKEIELSEKQKENVEQVLDLIFSMAKNDRESIRKGLENIGDKKDVLSLQVSAEAFNYLGDYEKAYEKAEKLISKENTMQNQLVITNLAVTGNIQSENDEEKKALEKEAREIYVKYSDLKKEADDVKESKKEKLIKEAESVYAKYLEKQQQAENIQIDRAINYINSMEMFGNSQEKFIADLQLSYLNYLKGNTEKAEKMLINSMNKAKNESNPKGIKAEIKKLLEAYDEALNTYDYKVVENIVKQINYSMTQGLKLNYKNKEEIGEFILRVLRELREGVQIVSVDTSDYPNIDVHLNLASEDTEIKSDIFTVYEMNEKISNPKLVVQENEEMAICLVMDKSGSMGGDGIVNAKNAIINFIRNVEKGVKVGLVCFDSNAYKYCEATQSVGTILSAVDGVEAGGGTNIPDGLRKGMEILENQRGNKIIILLSDGESSTAGTDEVIAELISKGIKVYSVGFGYADETYLAYISNSTDGKYLAAGNSSALNEIYSLIGKYISQEYILRFKVQKDTDNYERNVEVRMEDLYDIYTYDVGVSKEEILDEQNKTPKSDFYKQIGGSYK